MKKISKIVLLGFFSLVCYGSCAAENDFFANGTGKLWQEIKEVGGKLKSEYNQKVPMWMKRILTPWKGSLYNKALTESDFENAKKNGLISGFGITASSFCLKRGKFRSFGVSTIYGLVGFNLGFLSTIADEK